MKYAIVSLILLLVACNVASRCDVQDYKDSANPIIEKWQDAVKTADQTPRIALAAQIAELQEIRRETDNMEVDECFQDLHRRLVRHMDYTIDGFLLFMGQGNEDDVNTKFRLAESEMQLFISKLNSMSEE